MHTMHAGIQDTRWSASPPGLSCGKRYTRNHHVIPYSARYVRCIEVSGPTVTFTTSGRNMRLMPRGKQTASLLLRGQTVRAWSRLFLTIHNIIEHDELHRVDPP